MSKFSPHKIFIFDVNENACLLLFTQRYVVSTDRSGDIHVTVQVSVGMSIYVPIEFFFSKMQ